MRNTMVAGLRALWLPGLMCVLLAMPSLASAQEVHNEYQGTYRAVVEEVLSEEMQVLPGLDTTQLVQEVQARVLSGPLKDERIVLVDDFLGLSVGDRFFFNHNQHIGGTETFVPLNIDRRLPLMFLGLLFVGAVVLLGGWQGVRSLMALGGSFLAIFYVLLPGILAGWSPLFLSVLIAGTVLFAAIFFTHGFNRESLVAYGGTILAVCITSLFALFAVGSTGLTGFTDEVTTYLNFNTGGALNFTSLLLGAMIIGVLGVLDDIAITQAAVVSELYAANPALGRWDVYRRALRVGREHVSALVNTLVLAYTGAALPLLLYMYDSAASMSIMINTELIATEVVRTIVGSVGLILTVPIVTFLSVLVLKGYERAQSAGGHAHHHHHGSV